MNMHTTSMNSAYYDSRVLPEEVTNEIHTNCTTDTNSSTSIYWTGPFQEINNSVGHGTLLAHVITDGYIVWYIL